MTADTDQLLRHAGYAGSIEFSLEDGCLHGRVLHVNDLITYEGETLPELQANFEQAVDRYLAHCQSIGKTPDKPYTGSFNVRLGPDRHRRLAELGQTRNCSLNVLICEAVDGLLMHRQATVHAETLATLESKLKTIQFTADRTKFFKVVAQSQPLIGLQLTADDDAEALEPKLNWLPHGPAQRLVS